MGATRLIGQTAQAAGLIAFTPCRDSLTFPTEPLGDLTNGRATFDFSDSAQTDLNRDRLDERTTALDALRNE